MRVNAGRRRGRLTPRPVVAYFTRMVTPSTWLFSRQGESIRLVRPSDALVVIVEGPGDKRDRQEFADEAALQKYAADMAESLAERGWILLGRNYDRRHRRRTAAPPELVERRHRP